MCVLNTCVLRKSSCKHYRKKNTFSDCRLCGGGCFHKLLSPNTSNIRWRKRKPSSRIFATLAFHATIFYFGCDDNKEDISTSTVHRHQKNVIQIRLCKLRTSGKVFENRQSVCFTQNVLHLWLLAVIGLGTYICVCLSRADCHAPQFLLGNLRKPIDTTNNVSREIQSWCVLQK